MVKMQNLVPFCRRTFGVGTPPPPRWQCAGSCSSFARFRVFGLALLHSMFSKPIFSNFLVPPSLATWWKCKSWWHGSGTPPPPRRWQCAGSCSSFGERGAGGRLAKLDQGRPWWRAEIARNIFIMRKRVQCPVYLIDCKCQTVFPLHSEQSLVLTAGIRPFLVWAVAAKKNCEIFQGSRSLQLWQKW